MSLLVRRQVKLGRVRKVEMDTETLSMFDEVARVEPYAILEPLFEGAEWDLVRYLPNGRDTARLESFRTRQRAEKALSWMLSHWKQTGEVVMNYPKGAPKSWTKYFLCCRLTYRCTGLLRRRWRLRSR